MGGKPSKKDHFFAENDFSKDSYKPTPLSLTPNSSIQEKKENKNIYTFHNHGALCFLVLYHTSGLPLDVIRYILAMLIRGRKFEYASDFDKNGILYYLGTRGYSDVYQVRNVSQFFFSRNFLFLAPLLLLSFFVFFYDFAM